MKVYEIFNDSEKVIINAVCRGELLKDLTKEDTENELLVMMVGAAEEMKELVEDTLEKVKKLTESQWDELKMKTPLFVESFSEDGEDVEEVPTDEEIL